MSIVTTDPCPELPWLHVHPRVAKDNADYPKVIFFLRVVDWCWNRTIVESDDPWMIDTSAEWYRAGMAAWLAGQPDLAMEIVCGGDYDLVRGALRRRVGATHVIDR